jgi:hypothetical protein
MDDTAEVYVPASCEKETCKVDGMDRITDLS